MTVCNDCYKCHRDDIEIRTIFGWVSTPYLLPIEKIQTKMKEYDYLYMVDECVCKECYDKLQNKHEEQLQEERIEIRAKKAHQVWSHWMKHFMGRYCDVVRMEEDDSIAMIVPAKDILRWRRQMNTPYENLIEEEKESDRKVARKYLL